MKLKKKAKVMIVVSIVASLLSGCGFGEKQIDYKPFVKALDEGDMGKVMSASDDGYAYVKQRGIYSTYEQRKMESTVKQSIRLRKVYIIRKIKVYMEIQHKKLPQK